MIQALDFVFTWGVFTRLTSYCYSIGNQQAHLPNMCSIQCAPVIIQMTYIQLRFASSKISQVWLECLHGPILGRCWCTKDWSREPPPGLNLVDVSYRDIFLPHWRVKTRYWPTSRIIENPKLLDVRASSSLPVDRIGKFHPKDRKISRSCSGTHTYAHDYVRFFFFLGFIRTSCFFFCLPFNHSEISCCFGNDYWYWSP